jgi:hypothetical protein
MFIHDEFVLQSLKPGPQERSQDLLLNEGVINKKDYSGEKSTDELELPLFDFSTIAAATGNFCDENKLGEGGFGCVHKVNSFVKIM